MENPEAGAGEQYREIALETVRNNINFIEDFSEEIGAWMAEASADGDGGGDSDAAAVMQAATAIQFCFLTMLLLPPTE